MEDNSFASLKEILEDYFAKLKSSKEKDPNKNMLYQEIMKEINIMIAGSDSLEPYEKHLDTNFITFWKNEFFELFLEEYIQELNTRFEQSTNRQKLLELELKKFDQYDLSDTSLTGDIRKDGEKLGHLLAINGDNPKIASLIYHLTPYNFGIEIMTANRITDLLDDEHWQKRRNNYIEIFRKLHWVCRGYFDAQKLNYIRSNHAKLLGIESISLQDNGAADQKLTLKQQILVMHRLGILDLEKIQNMTVQNQGKLFGYLFNKNEKNAEDLIRNRHGKNVEKKFSLHGSEVTEVVDKLFMDLKIKL